jgi:stress response protein YsnF
MDGDVYVVPVIEEEIVISTRLRLKEELRVHRYVAERDETIQTPFRRERLVVEEHRYDDTEPHER